MMWRILIRSGAPIAQTLNMKETFWEECFNQMFYTQWQKTFLISPSDGHSLCAFQAKSLEIQMLRISFFFVDLNANNV